MYKVKLIKGLSCRVGKIRATKENPFCEILSKEDLNQALSSGYFKLVDSPQEKQALKLISKMTLEQCRSFAKEHEIDIDGLTKLAEIRTAISVALNKNSEEEIKDSNNQEFEFGFNE